MAKVIKDTDVVQLPPKSVLAGGCFDVLHPAHEEFLKKAKEHGNNLCILLESDSNIKKLKGTHRPLNNQSIRAKNLSNMGIVDIIILLNNPNSSQYYYNLVKLLRPAIIAVTAGDTLLDVKMAQAESVGGKVVEVMKRNTLHSSTKLINKTI